MPGDAVQIRVGPKDGADRGIRREVFDQDGLSRRDANGEKTELVDPPNDVRIYVPVRDTRKSPSITSWMMIID